MENNLFFSIAQKNKQFYYKRHVYCILQAVKLKKIKHDVVFIMMLYKFI